MHKYPKYENLRQSRHFRQYFDNSGILYICRKCRYFRIAGIVEKVPEIARIAKDLLELPGLSKIFIFWLILSVCTVNYIWDTLWSVQHRTIIERIMNESYKSFIMTNRLFTIFAKCINQWSRLYILSRVARRYLRANAAKGLVNEL